MQRRLSGASVTSTNAPLEHKKVTSEYHSPLVQVFLWFPPDEMKESSRFSARPGRAYMGSEEMRRSDAGCPHMHLFGDLQDEDDIWPLVWVRVDAHAHQVPQLWKSAFVSGAGEMNWKVVDI